jgi:hypothetical protein
VKTGGRRKEKGRNQRPKVERHGLGGNRKSTKAAESRVHELTIDLAGTCSLIFLPVAKLQFPKEIVTFLLLEHNNSLPVSTPSQS